MKEITIPKKLVPLVKAFSTDEESAKILIRESAKAVASSEKSSTDSLFDEGNKTISNEELEGILALMKGISPSDTLEMIYGAQIVTSHLMGLRLLSHSFQSDQVLGLKLLRFSNEALNQLQKKRSGGTNQNITVNYNFNGQGSAYIQTVIPKEE